MFGNPKPRVSLRYFANNFYVDVNCAGCASFVQDELASRCNLMDGRRVTPVFGCLAFAPAKLVKV